MPEEVAPQIYRISVPLPGNPLKELNSYWIKGDDRELLIDTGFRCQVCYEALEQGLAALGSDPARRDVLLTHIHSDHSGMADLFVGPGRNIYISEQDLRFERDLLYGSADELRRRRFISEGFAESLVDQIYASNPVRNMALRELGGQFRGLRDGETLTLGAYTLKTLLVPGHTPGNAVFWAEKQGLMFSGDHVLFDITPNITAWECMEDTLGSYLDSLRRISNYPVRVVLPGHRKPGNFPLRVQELLQHHQQRLAEVQKIVAETPGLTAYEITGRMTWNLRAKDWEHFPLIQKWFAVGEGLAHLDHLRKLGVLSRQMDEQIWHYY